MGEIDRQKQLCVPTFGRTTQLVTSHEIINVGKRLHPKIKKGGELNPVN